MRYRIEKDSLGEVRVPYGAYYGAQTKRAIDNFPISGVRFPRRFLWALGLIKRCCAFANEDLGLLDGYRAEWIAAAAQEVVDGRLDDHFPLDIFQTGSGTSTNMNANEVIANRAIELMGGELGSRDPVHPNDHVNMSQSSNDVIPTAIHVAGAVAIHEELLPALRRLHAALATKAVAFDGVIKSGRTHLMDATPVRLGQELGGYAAQVQQGIRRAEAARDALLELALGGTAVGTGLNCPAGFAPRAISLLADVTGLAFREAADHFEAQSAQDGVVEAHGLLKAVAASLMKIANDIRWLGSGPRTGFGELALKELAPGSSIMPGKVNPVMSEMLTQVCCQVFGNDVAVGMGGQGGAFELNTYLPLLAHNLLQSIHLLSSGARTFAEKCIEPLQANAERCRATVERNLALCTALAPVIGYDRAAAISKEALATDRSIREVARAQRILPDAELDALLDPDKMTRPG